MRLSRVIDFAAHLLVGQSDRTGARDEAVAALDHEIRIGADHEEIAGPHRRKARAIVLDSLLVIVVEARADDIVGALDRPEVCVEPVEDRPVARRPEMVDDLRDAILDDGASQVARRDDGVVSRARDAELVELDCDGFARSRRIGDEDDRARLSDGSA